MTKFTVGMAVFTNRGDEMEPARVRMTVRDLMMHHPMVAEIVVVDNNPYSGSPIYDFCRRTGKARYVPFDSPRGTAAPRNRIFAEAQNDYVCVIDPHVFIAPRSLEEVMWAYGREGVQPNDLMHGMLVKENDEVHSTHMNDQWRAGMWGTWGRAWTGPKGGLIFSCLHETGENTAYYVTVDPNQSFRRILSAEEISNGVGLRPRRLTAEEIRENGLPEDLIWEGHEQKLEALGFQTPLSVFRIPDHGMGFFVCRRDSWLPFHADAVGFGGEEMTTGVRFRRTGRNVWCVPAAKWWHDFGRDVTRPPYPMFAYHRIRNYVLEFRRNGMDPDEIRRHFFGREHMGDLGMDGRPSDWAAALAGDSWPAGIGPTGVPLPRDAGRAPRRAASPGVRQDRKRVCLTCEYFKESDGDPNDAKTPPDICGKGGKPAMDLIRWAECKCPDNPPRWAESVADTAAFMREASHAGQNPV